MGSESELGVWSGVGVGVGVRVCLGTHETIEMGSTKRPSSTTMTTRPHTRELVPERKVKMVCEKMYAHAHPHPHPHPKPNPSPNPNPNPNPYPLH